MKKNTKLTREQQSLVETHLYVVDWVIKESIHINKAVYGLDYEELYQEGCIWLCHASITYDPARARFSTYAKKVVLNGLLAYCREICSKQKPYCQLIPDTYGDVAVESFISTESIQSDSFEAQISIIETLDLLASAGKDFKGIAKLGIEALSLRVRGRGVTEIARLYHVPPHYVGAWISRAAQKLRKDPSFLSGLL